MYYGHVKSGDVLLKGMRRKGSGFSVSLFYISSGKNVDMPLSEVYKLLSSVSSYNISSKFYSVMSIAAPKMFISRIKGDIRMGKCVITN